MDTTSAWGLIAASVLITNLAWAISIRDWAKGRHDLTTVVRKLRERRMAEGSRSFSQIPGEEQQILTWLTTGEGRTLHHQLLLESCDRLKKDCTAALGVVTLFCSIAIIAWLI
jgi:hypothetical protein